jgi:C-terminal processing protease CtpA/Prc
MNLRPTTRFWLRAIAALLVLAGLVWLGLGLARARAAADPLALVHEVTGIVARDYVDELAAADKLPGALDGMTGALDSLSACLSAGQDALYAAMERGAVALPGFWGMKYQGFWQVCAVLPGSPAEQAGLERGDQVRVVDGVSLYGRSYWAMRLALLTPQPRTLRLTVLKLHRDKPLALAIATALPPPGSELQYLPGGAYRFSLRRFDAASTALWARFLAAHPDADCILDLTQGAEGDWNAFVAFTRLFLPVDPLTLRSRHGDQAVTLGSAQPHSGRFAVLIDHSTVFLAELLAYSCRSARIPLLGAASAGFAARLGRFPLADGHVLLMTAVDYIHAGLRLTARPLSPDIPIAPAAWPERWAICRQALGKQLHAAEKETR